jgi:hypothetical protein
MARRRPRAPNVVVSHGKVLMLYFVSTRKEARASEVWKVVERDPAWSWLLVDNSSYLNRDIGIMCDDSELRQKNPHVNPLVCLLVFLFSELLK